MHNPMNRNPEENRPLDPFAAAEAFPGGYGIRPYT